MTLLTDVALATWIIGVTATIFVVVPALALGRPPGRARWWPELLAGAAWSLLATTLLVPALSRVHLFNWATALLVPLTWPVALWLYRYRGAPAGEFRELCRSITLHVLASRRHSMAEGRHRISTRGAIACLSVAALVVWLDARELRLQSPADYDCLANARALIAGGQWIPDPAASVAALISRLAAVDPMQALRFLRALALPGSAMAWLTETCSLNIACAWSALFVAFFLGAVAGGGVHRRDRWHVLPACTVAIAAVMAPSAAGHADSGYVEYDATARQTLALARAFDRGDWVVVGLPEQRVELPDPRAFLALSTFVARFADRAGQRPFRFNVPGRHLFVFVEKVPLHIAPGTALVPVSYARTVWPDRLPNARARLEKRALELCEQYRRTHAGASIYYDDAEVRIYYFRH